MIIRPRRLRKSETIRRLVRETQLSVNDLIQPLFVTWQKDVKQEIPSMPGQFQLSIDHLIEEVKEIYKLGIPGIILFGIPESKDEIGSDTWSEEGIIQRAIRAVKEAVPDLLIITDVCFCEYTANGHCGVVKDGDVNNDLTLELLAKQVVSHAKTGADFVAPSCMMDGQVRAIRSALDESNFTDVGILSYAVKYASSFFGPFRDAVESSPGFGNRKTYQMDPANWREAMKEASLDEQEGADILMVKPALPYLDIISKVKDITNLPIAAFNVSGEYSMVKAAADNNWLDRTDTMLEMLTSIKRSGADLILTYFAKEAAKVFLEKNNDYNGK